MSQFLSLLQEHLQGFRMGTPGEVTGFCPFPHEGRSDQDGGTRSLAINYELGAWKCFSCKQKGNDYQLIAQLIRGSLKEAKQLLGYTIDHIKEVPINEVREAHQLLLSEKSVRDYLLDRKGLNSDTILKYQLGYATQDDRLWIPIRDELGRVVNVRRYALGKTRKSDEKYRGYKTGFNKARLWPAEDLDKLECVFLCEGETDTLLARQLGLPAITVTGGAGTWEDYFSKLLSGKTIYICYDCDDAGVTGALRVANNLHRFHTTIKVVNLNLPEKGDDVSDYFLKYGYTVEDLLNLIENTDEYVAPEERTVHTDDKMFEVDLAHTSLASLYGKKIKMIATVAGKDLAPYIYPKRLEVICEMNKGQKCQSCGLGVRYNGVASLTIDTLEDSILKFIATDDDSQKREIARRIQISPCNAWAMNILEAGNIEEVRLIPELDFSTEETEYVMRRGFFVGHGIRANASYEFEGIAGLDPQTQYSVPILSDARPVRGSLDDYQITPELIELLSLFKVGRQS